MNIINIIPNINPISVKLLPLLGLKDMVTELLEDINENIESGVADIAASILNIPFDMLCDAGNIAANCLKVDDKTTAMGIVSIEIGKFTKNLMTVLQGIGNGIAILIWMFAILDLVTSERLNLEQFIKHTCFIFISIAMIGMSPKLVTYMNKFGNGFAKLITGQKATPDKLLLITSDKIQPAIHSMNEGLTTPLTVTGNSFIFLVIILLLALVMIIVAVGIKIICYVICISRLIEINVRGAMTPVAFGLLSEDGFKGAGGRWLKQYLSVCCQGGVIVLIGKIMVACTGAVANNAIETVSVKNLAGIEVIPPLIGMLAVTCGVALAGVSAMFKSIQITNNVFGV